jgi:hypothetical protein
MICPMMTPGAIARRCRRPGSARCSRATAGGGASTRTAVERSDDEPWLHVDVTRAFAAL